MSEIGLRTLAECTLQELHALGDAPVRQLLAEFRRLVHASELAVWVKDPQAEQLVVLFETSGPQGTSGQHSPLELTVKQPLVSGIVSEVFREQKPYLDRGLWRSKKQSSLVDTALNQLTHYQICVPFTLAGLPMGVLSAVQLTDSKRQAPQRWSFDEVDLKLLSLAAFAVGQAVERSFLSRLR